MIMDYVLQGVTEAIKQRQYQATVSWAAENYPAMHEKYEDAQTADTALQSKIRGLQAELEETQAAQSQSAQQLLGLRKNGKTQPCKYRSSLMTSCLVMTELLM